MLVVCRCLLIVVDVPCCRFGVRMFVVCGCSLFIFCCLSSCVVGRSLLLFGCCLLFSGVFVVCSCLMFVVRCLFLVVNYCSLCVVCWSSLFAVCCSLVVIVSLWLLVVRCFVVCCSLRFVRWL